MKLLKITKSNRSGKKMMAIFYNEKTGREKTTHFGAEGMSDFTKHKDKERKQRLELLPEIVVKNINFFKLLMD